ncbi:MAG: thioredoxin family protein [bacterium]|nr:thioredoxin family protein [bacterium]
MLDRIGIGFALVIAGLLFVATRVDAERSATPAELGEVAWLRNYDEAARSSADSGKPVFLLFQEVPGCATCVNFGGEVLSHPRLVEAIEDEFVPLAILNNVGGHDREVLRRFGEPAWNNPVVRFVDARGNDLLPRRDRVWTDEAVATRMIDALEASGRAVPRYVASLRDELAPARIERATLSMACYWVGEACLGGIDGLLSSRAGHLGGREVVEVRFDPTRVSYAQLLRKAFRNGCADGVFAHDDAQLAIAKAIYPGTARRAPGIARDASDRDQLFHLKRFPALAALEATPAERLRLNHAAWKKQDPTPLLSPRQREALN